MQSESKEQKQEFVPTKQGTVSFSAKAPSNLSTESNPDHFAEKKPPTNKPGPVSTARNGSTSSVKRTFSDVERSPESLEIQAKKSNAHYKRCFEIPEETRFHTGLTGTFSTIQVGDFMASTEGMGSAEDQVPNRSSPIAVAKSLFCELEEPTEDVFEDVAKDSSFTSPLTRDSDVCRSLSLDSDGSMHDTSLTVDTSASCKCSKNRKSASFEEQEESKDSSITESLLQTSSAGTTETPTTKNFGQRGEPQRSFLNRFPDLASGVAQSPSFLKPRNVVAFRSYCSSIDRSNMSGVSRLSVGSVEAMDVSAAASCNSVSGTMTPVQKRPDSLSSLYQVNTPGHNINI